MFSILKELLYFSRGGAAAFHTGNLMFMFINVIILFYFVILALTTPHLLAGVLALSTWLPLSSTFPKVKHKLT